MFYRKHRTIFFVIVLGLFLSSISVSTNSASLPILKTDIAQPCSIVWSDDFENTTETLNDWEFTGHNLTDWGEPYTPDFTLSDGLLYSNGPGITSINHDSTIAVGTWSLDLFLGEADDYRIWVVFTSPYWDDYYYSPEGYAFIYDSWGAVNRMGLVRIQPDFAGAAMTEIDEVPFENATGWMHIDITRQSDNRMYIFLNGTLILQGIDTELSTSEYFRLYSEYYFIADNVTVTDTVDFDVTRPHWTKPLVNHMINEGDDFNHTLFTEDYSGIDTWWVNDTNNFVITQQGNIASTEPLPLGTYGVEVYVNDTFGNVLSGSFNVKVIEWSPSTSSSTSTTTYTSGTNTTSTDVPFNLGFIGIGLGIGIIVSVFVLVVLNRSKS